MGVIKAFKGEIFAVSILKITKLWDGHGNIIPKRKGLWCLVRKEN
jgi:hypothetical protein